VPEELIPHSDEAQDCGACLVFIQGGDGDSE
jgi:hypothetical protein